VDFSWLVCVCGVCEECGVCVCVCLHVYEESVQSIILARVACLQNSVAILMTMAHSF